MTDPRVEEVLARLTDLRAGDAPTRGGRVLSYVYDPGLAVVDELARRAAEQVQHVNGLDPTAFGSVARMEADVIGFAAGLVHGADTVGVVTSGGTESCLLAVKSARDRWRTRHPGVAGPPVIVAPVTAHAAFHKAAEYFGLHLDRVPVGTDGTVGADQLIGRCDERTALVVVSAPNYPFGVIDPVAEVAPRAAALGIACHVDACIGGWVLPFWGEPLPRWDFRISGVASMSLDAHKYGYSPKGVSVLLFADRDAKRAASFATTEWPGYPVVNPTMLGSRSATSLAAAWAVLQYLGVDGLAELTARTRRATEALLGVVAGIDGLRVVGTPAGPLFAVRTDPDVDSGRGVDPHQWSDRVRELGWTLQPQPGLRQRSGQALAPTTHLTITPVTADNLDALTAAMVRAADDVRGRPPIDLSALPDALPALRSEATLDSAAAGEILAALGLADGGPTLPDQLAPVMALLKVIDPARAQELLTELLARLNENPAAPCG